MSQYLQRATHCQLLLSAILLFGSVIFANESGANEPNVVILDGFPLAATTTTPNLNARSGPGTTYAVVYEFKEKGSNVVLFSYNNGWYLVSPSYHKSAWVHGRYLVRDRGLSYSLNKHLGKYDYYFSALAPEPRRPAVEIVAPKNGRATTLPMSARINTAYDLQFEDIQGRQIDWQPARALVEHIVVYEMTESQYRITPDVSYFEAWISRDQVHLTPDRPLPPQHPHYDGNSVRTKRYALAYIKDLHEVREKWIEDTLIQQRVQQTLDAHERSQIPFAEHAANFLVSLLIFFVPPAIFVFTLVQSTSLSHHAGYYIGVGVPWLVMLVSVPASWQIPAFILALAIVGAYWLLMQTEWEHMTNYQPWKGVSVSEKPVKIIMPGEQTAAMERAETQELQQGSPPVTRDNFVEALVARLFGRHLSEGLKEVENYHQGHARVQDARLEDARAQGRWNDRVRILDVESDDREIAWRKSRRAVERERAIDQGEGEKEARRHKPRKRTDIEQFHEYHDGKDDEAWAADSLDKKDKLEQLYPNDPERVKREFAIYLAAVAEYRAKLHRR